MDHAHNDCRAARRRSGNGGNWWTPQDAVAASPWTAGEGASPALWPTDGQRFRLEPPPSAGPRKHIKTQKSSLFRRVKGGKRFLPSVRTVKRLDIDLWRSALLTQSVTGESRGKPDKRHGRPV